MKNSAFQALVVVMFLTQPISAQEAGGAAAAEAAEDAVAALEEAIEGLGKEDRLSDAKSETRLDRDVKDVFDRGCGDDNGLDRCDPEIQSKVRDLYGLDSIEALAESGTSVLRTMLVDGYGNDVAAISFVRKKGKSPYVEVRSPSLTPSNEQPLRANISDLVWQRVEGMSKNFDKKLAHEATDDGNVTVMCLHGWVTIAEKVIQASPRISTKGSLEDGEIITVSQEIVRSNPLLGRDTESACANGLAMPFSFALADEAMRALPECSNLDLDDFRNSAMLVATCHRLRGDRLSAAKAYSVVRQLELYQRRSDKGDISSLFVSMDDGESERFLADLEGKYVFFGMPNATSETEASVESQLYYFVEKQPDIPTEEATLTIQLYDYAGDFRILSWSMSPKRPFVQLQQ